MRSAITIPLASLFVCLAGFNVWVMLSGRTAGPQGHQWVLAHRAAGYTFITIFVIISFFMLLRIKGLTDELSPRLTLHAALALLLVPLIFTKVVLVRSKKAPWIALMTLGISIFSSAFILVAVNVSVHYLRNASPHRLPSWLSILFVITICLLALRVLLAVHPPRKVRSRPQPNSVS
jgi:hypothetical protein